MGGGLILGGVGLVLGGHFVLVSEYQDLQFIVIYRYRQKGLSFGQKLCYELMIGPLCLMVTSNQSFHLLVNR